MPTGYKRTCAVLAVLLLCPLAGCRSGRTSTVSLPPNQSSLQVATPSTDVALPIGETSSPSDEVVALPALDESPSQTVHSVAFLDAESGVIPEPLPANDRPTSSELEIDALVAEVLAINPDIRSATAAWRAAARRYPQEVALDDPMFGFLLGPGSWGSDEVDDAYMVELSQKVPWHGKRQLRGNIARAEANAAYFDVSEDRLRIAEVAKLAYYQYYLAHRQLDVLRESTELLSDFREIAMKQV